MSDIKLTNEILNRVIGKSINRDNIIDLTINIIQLVETYADLKGNEKKNMVIQILLNLNNNSSLSLEEKSEINFLIQTLVPNIIDGLISAANGKLFETIKGTCGCC